MGFAQWERDFVEMLGWSYNAITYHVVLVGV